MDTEFINAYIEKTKVALDDFLAKTLLLETHLHIAQKRVQMQQEEIENLKIQLEVQINKNAVKEKREKKTEEASF